MDATFDMKWPTVCEVNSTMIHSGEILSDSVYDCSM